MHSVVSTFVARALSVIMLLGVGATHSTAAPQDAPSKPWHKMKKAERKDYMKKVVLPRMRQVLSDFDDKRFGDVQCVTCHGPGAKKDHYDMPNPKLPKLPSSDDGWKKLREKQQDIITFMNKRMVPEMAALLGEKPKGPENPKGFGCSDCHTKGK